MKIEIEFKQGRWLVNGKRLQDMNHDEKTFMDDFFREIKAIRENENISHHNTNCRVRHSVVRTNKSNI